MSNSSKMEDVFKQRTMRSSSNTSTDNISDSMSPPKNETNSKLAEYIFSSLFKQFKELSLQVINEFADEIFLTVCFQFEFHLLTLALEDSTWKCFFHY